MRQCRLKQSVYTMETERKRYEFVRFGDTHEGGKIYPTWWFVAKTADDVREHYEKVFLPVMQRGWDSFCEKQIECIHAGRRVCDHANNEAEIAIQSIAMAKGIGDDEFDMPILPTYEVANDLISQALDGRIKMVEREPVYLEDGMRQFAHTEGSDPFFKVAERVYCDELVYPHAKVPTMDDVRFIQWPDGKHWYAKIGNVDVVDTWGTQKWDTLGEAKKAAWLFIGRYYTEDGRENRNVSNEWFDQAEKYKLDG